MALIALCVFFAIMVGIGLWGMKKTSTLNDFFLGGRNIGPWISALAYGTTYFSAVLFIGFAGRLGWGFGFNALWIALGNTLIGSLLAWLVLARRTRIMTQNLNAMTMPEFFHERYEGKYIKMICAAIIFVFLIPYTASVFKGLGYLFEAYFHIPYETALFWTVLVTGAYLILGGYFAVTLTDFIQGILMIFGSIAMVYFLTAKAGGFSQAIASAVQLYPQHIPPAKQPDMLTIVSLVFMTSFGVWGMPQMVHKYYALKNPGIIKTAAIATTIFALIISFSAYFIGALTHVFYSAPLIVNGAPAFDRMIPQLLTNYIPGGLMILILLLILSASMSTLSSLILVSASAVAIDMYKGHIRPNISAKGSLAMMRFLSGVFVVLAYFIAKQEFYIIVTLMALSWGAIAGAFMAPYIYGLYWKGTTNWGVKAGMITGLSLSVSLFFLWGQARSPIASSVAMIVPFFVVPVVSFFTKPPSKHVLDKAFHGI